MGIAEKLLGWIPDWVGFVLIILAGIGAVIVGALLPYPGAVAFGIAAILSSIIAWIAGAVSKPHDVNPFKRSFGGKVERVPMVAWIIIFLLFLAAAIVAIVTGLPT